MKAITVCNWIRFETHKGWRRDLWIIQRSRNHTLPASDENKTRIKLVVKSTHFSITAGKSVLSLYRETLMCSKLLFTSMHTFDLCQDLHFQHIYKEVRGVAWRCCWGGGDNVISMTTHLRILAHQPTQNSSVPMCVPAVLVARANTSHKLVLAHG